MNPEDQKLDQEKTVPNLSMGLIGQQQFKNKLYKIIPCALRELKAPNRRLPSYLLYGSTGSGKGLIVNQFYTKLREINKKYLPYEIVECNAVAESLLHTDLFGIEEKTASDVKSSLGRITLANGGLIQFDEIGKASRKILNEILIWMERGHFHRLGNITRKTSRAIAVFTMSENPYDLVSVGKWGIDFLNRFRNIIQIPPLAENSDYILQLANTFAKSFLDLHSNGNNLKVEFSKKLQARIMNYSWPGNIRELENTIDRWIMEVMAEPSFTSQSILVLDEDLFDKYPPPLKPLGIKTSLKSLTYSQPRNLKEYDNKTKPMIEKHILSFFCYKNRPTTSKYSAFCFKHFSS